MMGCPVTYVIDNAAPTCNKRQTTTVSTHSGTLMDAAQLRIGSGCENKKARSKAHLVVDGVPLGDEHTIDTTLLAARRSGEVTQRAIEFRELVDRLVSDQSFADKDDLIRVVRRDKL